MASEKLDLITKWPTEKVIGPNGAALEHRSDLTSDQVRESLRDGPMIAGIANVGHPMRWVSGSALFEVWKSEVKARLHEPSDRLDNDRETRYLASLWSGVDGDSEVIVFFAHH